MYLEMTKRYKYNGRIVRREEKKRMSFNMTLAHTASVPTIKNRLYKNREYLDWNAIIKVRANQDTSLKRFL